MSGGHGLAGPVGWTILGLVVGLTIFYGWRTASNREGLTERNLRELDRIGHSIEGRTEGFAAGMTGWHKARRAGQALGAASFRELVPDLQGEPARCGPGQPRAVVNERRVRFCYGFVRDTAGVGGQPWPEWWSGDFSLEPLSQALQSDLFEATFLAADSTRVLLSHGLAGLRLHEIPFDTASGFGGRVSTVRNVAIAGREYLLFLQPLDIRGPAAEPLDSARGGLAPVSWSVGGLVSVARFRADSLALDPPHLIFLGLLLVLAVLALPYLRAALMDRWESIKVVDVYLLSLSAVLATGILGIAVADVHHYGPYSKYVDRNLAQASERLATAFHREIRLALLELDHWERYKADSTKSRVRIWEQLPDTAMQRIKAEPDRYFRFQMLIWVKADGMQADKLTPRDANTPSIPVSDRAYFRRIKEQQGYVLPAAAPDTAPRPYYIESIRSKNTGEKIAVVSAPYCWAAGATGGFCPADSLGVRTVTTGLASLDAPLLPPGVRFAIVQRDGLTLFHSDPERNLEENFLVETDDDPHLGALLAGRDSGSVRTTYMGRRSRLHVTPLAGSDSLSLVLVLDESLPGTARFESMFLSLAVFLAWVLVMWVGFLAVELITPRRLHWAWPDRDRPAKYPLLTGLLLGFTALLVGQAALAIEVRLPVDPASFLVPIQAISVALLLQSTGWYHQSAPWRNPRVIGWAALGAATLLQLALHLRTPAPTAYQLLLWTAQLAMVVLALWLIRRFDRREQREDSSALLEPWYVAAIVVTLAVTALLPAYLLHQEAFSRQRNRLVHYEQARLLEGLEARENRVRAANRQLGLGTAFDTLSADTLDLVVPPVLGARASAVAARGCREFRSDFSTSVFSRVERRMPFVTSAAIEMRHLESGAAGVHLETCAGDVLRLASAAPRTPLRSDLADHFRQSSVPSFGAVGRWRLLLLLALLAAGCGAVFVLARWLGRRVFLLDLPDALPLDINEQLPIAAARSGKAGGGASLIAICNRSLDRDQLNEGKDSVHFLDLLELAGANTDVEHALNAAPADRLLVLDHFDHRLNDHSWSDRLLLALESHVLLRGRNVVLMTSREPRALFPLAEQLGGAPDETRERWIRLLGQFVDVEVAESGEAVAAGGETQVGGEEGGGVGELTRTTRVLKQASSSAALPASLLTLIQGLVPIRAHAAARAVQPTAAERVLDRECAAHKGLAEIAVRVRKRPDFQRLTPEAIVEQVREMAESHYHALWAELEADEKLVVSQLAHGVVVNPNVKRAVRRLLARRIVIRQPELRLMNDSFRKFLQEEVPASFEEREYGEPSSAWQRVRFPIGLGLVVVIGFLFVTQRGAFDSAIALVTAAGLGSTAILKLISVIRPGRSGE